MKHVIDLDLENHSSWQGALDMILTLCGEAADLSFDCRMLGGRKTPTAEFRLEYDGEGDNKDRHEFVQDPADDMELQPSGQDSENSQENEPFQKSCRACIADEDIYTV